MVKRKDVPCLKCYVDSDGFFCCEAFELSDTAKNKYDELNEDPPIICENCVHDSSSCASCVNLINSNLDKDPSHGYCNVKHSYVFGEVCDNYSLRLAENKEEMLKYINETIEE